MSPPCRSLHRDHTRCHTTERSNGLDQRTVERRKRDAYRAHFRRGRSYMVKPPSPTTSPDLHALKLVHPRCVATGILFHHPRGRPLKPGLA
ncbi:hypothetical protein EDB85DRAFT_812638 [Lactarius pseudohatsudake]|nr:hypothetical protein EDB85DRAFT_812638 [Lactarius pseudohatsudake]